MTWEKKPFLTQIFIIWQLMETAGREEDVKCQTDLQQLTGRLESLLYTKGGVW